MLRITRVQLAKSTFVSACVYRGCGRDVQSYMTWKGYINKQTKAGEQEQRRRNKRFDSIKATQYCIVKMFFSTHNRRHYHSHSNLQTKVVYCECIQTNGNFL